ncbi:HAD family hydrolase [Pseudomonas sp. HN2-3]|uniref:HAD family hydrolase n=1 Tax=Pseudomonas sp. HN2-3 TaxID=2886360 RepID=UPI001D12050F|nr:HAD family hydrolase [Pseudomonas sp. HN2-3]UDU83180.1 HAD family hydrolase [Pseudomonas sp. HN2-3]
MPVIAAVFDAFGTTVQIKCKRHPFRKLLRIGTQHGRKPNAGDLHRLMTSSLGLQDAAELFGISLSAHQLRSLQDDLDEELESISVYPDAIEGIRLLKAEGLAVGICSNLAMPYGPVLRNLLGDVDGFALSYELGVMKPNHEIYREVCHQLGVRGELDTNASGGRIVMIGDSQLCDRDGPDAIGMCGYYLDRSGNKAVSNLVEFAELVLRHEHSDDGVLR